MRLLVAIVPLVFLAAPALAAGWQSGMVEDEGGPVMQAWVEGDAFLLRQAVANFIENAAAFSPAGSTIDARVVREGERVSDVVADRGAGIPDYALPRVFERFYSLPRPEGGSRSSGLGLCFVAEVAALHGGRATLENAPNGGAIATLELPEA